MQKIILDTNIIVSSLIQKSYPYLIVEYCIEGKAIVCISDAILREYVEVLNRPKFLNFSDFIKNAEFFLTCLSSIAKVYEPNLELEVIKDKPDNRFLELAVVSKADFIITGNTNDFTMDSYMQTKIVSPREFWEKFK